MQRKIAMISYHTCPLASEEGKETGGMNIYVLHTAKELAKQGFFVDIFTRSQNPDQPHIVHIAENIRLMHIKAGPESYILPNVEKINAKRKEINFPGIKMILVPYVKADDKANVTSERIRKGDIDRAGFVYQSVFTKPVLSLPGTLRPTLQKPIGTLVPNTTEVLNLIEGKIVISVGDIISEELRQKKFHPAISIIDFRTRRHELLHESFGKETHTVNRPGKIHKEAVDAFISVRNAYFSSQESQTLIVDGEEDLLALPAMLLAPMGSVVLYGLFDQGVVVNVVTEELKVRIKGIIEKFDY